MAISAGVLNTWAASTKETGEAASRLAAIVRACDKPGSGVPDEGKIIATAALEHVEAAQESLSTLQVLLGIA